MSRRPSPAEVAQRRAAIAAALADDPDMPQAEVAKLVGCSQKTVSRDVEAMRLVATEAVAQQVSDVPTAGELYRQRMDAELARLAGVMGADVVWSVAELEMLAAASDAMDRRARMLLAYNGCDDPLGQRALDAARELRLVERQITTMTSALQAGLGKLLAQWESEQAKATEEPERESSASRKARKAVQTRWRREELARDARNMLAQRQSEQDVG